MTSHSSSSLLVFALLLAACSDDISGPNDSGLKDKMNGGDVGGIDGSLFDGPIDPHRHDGSGDTGGRDTQIWDARIWEARTWDTRTWDTATLDTGAQDISNQDAATPDTITQDLGAQDTSTQDLAYPDTAIQDISTQDAVTGDTSAQDTARPDSSARDTSPPDAATADISAQDTSAQDTTPVSPCVPGVTVEVLVPGVMVACMESIPSRTQCNAAALCGPGWHLCTASEYKAHFTSTAPPITKSYWIAGCVRAGGVPFAPVDAACSFCGGATGSEAAVGWGCTANITVVADDLSVGLRASTSCGVVGIEASANEAYWQPWPTNELLPGAVCCN